MDECFLHGLPFPVLLGCLSVGDRDERKFTGLSFLDFQDFLVSKREMGGKFQRFYFWLFRFFFSVKVRDGRNSSCRVLFSFFSEFPFLEGREMD